MSESCRDVCDIVILKLQGLGFEIGSDEYDHSAVMAALPQVEFILANDARIQDSTFAPLELQLLVRLATVEHWTSYHFTRKSQRPFDIDVEGKFSMPTGGDDASFSAWLPLSAIHSIDWPKPEIWALQDGYGAGVPEDYRDWSGIRDSTREAVWEMFGIALRELLPEGGTL